MTTKNSDDEEKLRCQKAKLAVNVGAQGNLLKGSLIERFTVCTRPGCRCARGHKHGPYLYVSVSVFDGKRSRQVYVPKSMEKEVRSWVKNYGSTKKLIDNISAINIELIKLKRQKRQAQVK